MFLSTVFRKRVFHTINKQNIIPKTHKNEKFNKPKSHDSDKSKATITYSPINSLTADLGGTSTGFVPVMFDNMFHTSSLNDSSL